MRDKPVVLQESEGLIALGDSRFYRCQYEQAGDAYARAEAISDSVAKYERQTKEPDEEFVERCG